MQSGEWLTLWVGGHGTALSCGMNMCVLVKNHSSENLRVNATNISVSTNMFSYFSMLSLVSDIKKKCKLV